MIQMDRSPIISITGGTVWGNRGAESMLVTSIGVLRKYFPQARFHVFSYLPKKDRELVQDEAVNILSCKPLSLPGRHLLAAILACWCKRLHIKIPKSSFFNIARALAESDVLLDVGGITFSDGREKFLPFNILTIWPAMLLDVPVVKLAQAVGPFKHACNRWCANVFLKRCQYIFARGEKSAVFLAEIGYPAQKTDTVADVAFLYRLGFSLSRENDAKVEELLASIRKRKRPLVVLSPSILVEQQCQKLGQDYGAKFFEIIHHLGARAYQYVFIPNATREGSQEAHNNDLVCLARLRERAHTRDLNTEELDCVEWVDYDVNTSSIRKIIAGADLLITSRYHAMISGLSLAVPTLVMGWGHKYKETMEYFQMGAYSLDFGDRSADLPSMAAEAFAKRNEIRHRLREHFPAVEKKAALQFEYLKQVLS